MHTQLLSSSSPLLDSIFILLILLIPACYCQDDDRFNECQQHSYSCGENRREIGYPFWGNGRPQYCGHPKFELMCPDKDDYPVMDIGNRAFRVRQIDNNTRAMRIARLNLQEEYCPQEFKTRAFYVNDSYLWFHPPDGTTTNCRESIKVPIDYTTLNRLSSGSFPSLQKALEEEIQVEYHAEVDDCWKCVGSGGLCGSDLQTYKFVCICKNHSEDLKLCRDPGTTQSNEESKDTEQLTYKVFRGLGKGSPKARTEDERAEEMLVTK